MVLDEELFKLRNEAISNRDSNLYAKLYTQVGFSLDSDIERELIERHEADRLIFNKPKKEFVFVIPGLDYYIPRSKWELIKWIEEYCEATGKQLPKRFSKMKKKQLYAIYFNIRNKGV